MHLVGFNSLKVLKIDDTTVAEKNKGLKLIAAVPASGLSTCLARG
jgi:hypothetical protein